MSVDPAEPRVVAGGPLPAGRGSVTQRKPTEPRAVASGLAARQLWSSPAGSSRPSGGGLRGRRRLRACPTGLILAMAALSAAPILKIGDIQAVEILQAASLCLAAPAFLYGGMRVPAYGVWRRYGARYAVFLGVALGLSIMALRLPFFPPPDVSAIKKPLLLSLSRIFELILAMYFMLAIANALAARPSLLRRGLDVYSTTGVLTAAASLSAWILMKSAGLPSFLVYGYEGRIRGLFNEGGPYGMFLVSVSVAMLVRRRLFAVRYLFLHRTALAILAAALFVSGSKAGLLAAILLCVVGAAASASTRLRIALAGACLLTVFAFFSLFEGRLYGYFYAYVNFDTALAFRPEDPSLIMGRVAASIIAPRMIAAHPWSGIGVGNYSLMRNDPEYLQGLPPVDAWDLPGLGLLGSAAEFGIPLTLFFLAVLLRPAVHAFKRGAPAVVGVAVAFQPVAFLLGVNLNFFYPWLIAAFALSREVVNSGGARGGQQ